MRIAITGGTGFVGRHLTESLTQASHQVVLLARGQDRRDENVRKLPNAQMVEASLEAVDLLAKAFAGCEAVAHCAGINREIKKQSYQRVHIQGTQNVVQAAKKAGVKKIILLSFIRARPHCGSPYHESKWAAEEIVRQSGLDYTIIKAGVIYGQGDHMLDHLSHAFYTFPFFAFIGRRKNEKEVAPLAVADLVKIIEASLIHHELSRQTVVAIGPEKMPLSEAVKRVAKVVNKKPYWFYAPVKFHMALAWFCERFMKIPLVAKAQVKILAEGAAEPCGEVSALPQHLMPQIPFDSESIQKGLPAPKSFGCRDLRFCRGR